ncbi:hypothetical protein LJB86_04140 [Deltaproteobacteria bacterium OttesenSCG-928-M10]|nr:hypothetical protein [Deltaproteobacteria bacterium OttesenSCG-928-M10]
MVNSRNIFVRIALVLMTVTFTPAGVMVLRAAFAIKDQPHLFVMLVFSGCLTVLVGLVGLVGFVASFASKGAPRDKTSDDEQ